MDMAMPASSMHINYMICTAAYYAGHQIAAMGPRRAVHAIMYNAYILNLFPDIYYIRRTLLYYI